MKEDRGVYHILLIDHFYVDLKHYKPFAEQSLLIRSDRPIDIAFKNVDFLKRSFRGAFGKILSSYLRGTAKRLRAVLINTDVYLLTQSFFLAVFSKNLV
jgi:hypothetical protein